MAAPTFFGVATNPADAGSATEPATLTLTPPGSMTTGDLVVVMAYNENGSVGDGKAVNNTGGQTWTTDTTAGSYEYGGSAAAHKIWWCRFNGTWSANPTFDFPAVAGTRGIGLQMLVFRPDTSTKLWAVDISPTWAAFSAPSTPFTVTITGVSPTKDDTVTIARWCSDDDNTWDTLSGTGWSKTGLGAQYRNTGGSDLSTTFAYYLQGSSPTSTGNVSQNQATLGGDAGSSLIFTFYAYSGSPSITPAVTSKTLTGNAPTLVTDTRLTAALDDLTTTGQTPSLLQGYNLTPALGALVLSGETPTIEKSDFQIVTPDVGTLSVSGQAPVLDLALFPTLGSLSITGEIPTTSENTLLTPDLNALTLTGYLPTVTESSLSAITPAVGTMFFSGSGSVYDLAIRPGTA